MNSFTEPSDGENRETIGSIMVRWFINRGATVDIMFSLSLYVFDAKTILSNL